MGRTKPTARTAGAAKLERTRASSRSQPKVIDLSGSDTETDQWDTGDEWEVEKVIGKQVDANGRLKYHLKWRNWKGEPTWEPKANCRCDKLIAEYEEGLRESTTRSSGRRSASSSDNRSISPAAIESPTPSISTGPARHKKTPKRGSRI